LSQDVFGTDEKISRKDMVCRAIRKVHDQVAASPRKDLPIIWSEYNASYKNEPDVTDADFMGPWLASTIGQCDGLVSMLSYWAFSDVFEEQGVVKEPFYGGFGLMAADNIPKPSFNAFKVLHGLGTTRIALDSRSALVTRRADGTIVVAVWNLFLPEETGSNKRVTLSLTGTGAADRATIYRVDSRHGSAAAAYAAMGKPAFPTQAQIQSLRSAATLPAPEKVRVQHHQLTIDLPPQGLAVIEFR